jgi:hypothetical protein
MEQRVHSLWVQKQSGTAQEAFGRMCVCVHTGKLGYRQAGKQAGSACSCDHDCE